MTTHNSFETKHRFLNHQEKFFIKYKDLLVVVDLQKLGKTNRKPEVLSTRITHVSVKQGIDSNDRNNLCTYLPFVKSLPVSRTRSNKSSHNRSRIQIPREIEIIPFDGNGIKSKSHDEDETK